MADRTQLFHDLVSGRRRGPLAAAARAGLWAASLPYGVGVRVRNRLFDAGLRRLVTLPVPVVCVGNLSMGGTGKTPMVEWVARQLVEMGRRPAIVSRGYGAGDEARVLEDNLPDVPHLCGADRAAVALTAVEELEADCIVLDDGFQHRRLHRDLDIVLIDATARLPDEDYLFPRGTLREPERAVKRAGLVVVTRCDQERHGLLTPGGKIPTLAAELWLSGMFDGDPPQAFTVHAPLELIASDGTRSNVTVVSGRPVGLVSGIGNPKSFRLTAVDLGAVVQDERVFADHHAYTRADVDALRRWADTLPSDALVLTTQKDMVKLQLPDLSGRPMYAVRVGIRFFAGETLALEKIRAAVGEPTGVAA